MTYIAEPIQRTELRSLAKVMRETLQVEDRLYIPVITILENVMPLLFPDFSYEYVPREEFPKKKHGETDIVNHIIRIREDVYYGATEGNGRDRMTVSPKNWCLFQKQWQECGKILTAGLCFMSMM